MRGIRYLDKEIMELSFKKDMEEEEELEIEVAVAYRLDIAEEENICFGNAEIEICDESRKKLSLRVCAVGVFSYEGNLMTEEEQMQLHDETLKEFTPILNGIAAQLAALAEVPAVPISYEDFSSGTVEVESFTESLN